MKFIKAIFNFCGFDIKRINSAQKCNPLEHNSVENIDKFYSNHKKVWEYINDNSWISYYQSILKTITDNNISFDGRTVVDVGSGTGHFLKLLNETYPNVKLTGFEISVSATRFSKKLVPNANFLIHDIYNNFPLKFDIVVCLQVLEHLLYPDQAFQNLINAVNPGGVLFLAVPEGRTDVFDGHINFWSPESWKVFVERNVGCYDVEVGLFDTVNYAIIRTRERELYKKE